MDLVSQQLLRALRGGRSQLAWARRLGYRGNPITDWENGRSYPTAEEALRVAAKAGINVPAAFERFDHNLRLAQHDDAFDAGGWARQLCANKRATELAVSLGRSRSSVSRWLSGAAKPRLPDFLRLVDAATGRVHDLVAALVDVEQVPALAARYDAASAARRLAFDAPWTEALLRLVETTAYHKLSQHDDAWLAGVLGVAQDECSRGIEALIRAGLLRFDGTHYAPGGPLNVDTRGGKQALRALKTHWATVAADRATQPHAGDVFGYNVMSVSAADLLQIRELLGATFREVRAIVAASEPAERVALLNLHLVCWGDEGAGQ